MFNCIRSHPLNTHAKLSSATGSRFLPEPLSTSLLFGVRAAAALARLYGCAGSPEHTLRVYAEKYQ